MVLNNNKYCNIMIEYNIYIYIYIYIYINIIIITGCSCNVILLECIRSFVVSIK